MPKDDKIKIGIIGVGDCAKRLLYSLKEHEKFKLHSIADITPKEEKMSIVKKIMKTKTKYVQLQPYREIPVEFFEELDTVFIASPNEFHLYQTLDSLYKDKDLLVVTEKPLVVRRGELATIRSVMHHENFFNRLFFQDHYLLKPLSMYTFEKIRNMIKKYGKIERIKGTFFEEGNLQDLPRDRWLISPAAGGGVFIDVGIHLIRIIAKIFKGEFTLCEKAEFFDMYPDYHFECETGFYGKFLVTGNWFTHTKESNVTIKVAKGVRMDEETKLMEIHLQKAILYLDYEKNTFTIVTKSGMTKEINPPTYRDEYDTLLDMLYKTIKKRTPPFLSFNDCDEALRAIFEAYDKVGGVANIENKLTRRYTEIENFIRS